jgi:hypothetical protein
MKVSESGLRFKATGLSNDNPRDKQFPGTTYL